MGCSDWLIVLEPYCACVHSDRRFGHSVESLNKWLTIARAASCPGGAAPERTNITGMSVLLSDAAFNLLMPLRMPLERASYIIKDIEDPDCATSPMGDCTRKGL